MFQLELFGGVRIVGPGGPLGGRVAQRRQLALLAFLALHDRPISRDRLLAVFWPETDTERARHALSDAIYVIRRALGDDALRSHGDDLLLDRDRVQSDVAAFQGALAAGALELAVDLYAGPFLDGFHPGAGAEFENWLQSERARLSNICLTAAESVAAERERAGDPAAAVAWWRRAAALEPHNSRIALGLTRALADSGDRAGAVRFADLHARLLADEYGIAPPPDFSRYAADLRSNDGFDDDVVAANDVVPTADVSSASDVVPAEHAPATDDVAAADDVAITRHTTRRYRIDGRSTWPLAPLLLALIALVIAALRTGTERPPAEPLDPQLVAVLPFRAAGLHPDLAYLGEGMVDLLAAGLTGEAGGLRALPPGLVLGTPHDVDAAAQDPPARDAAIAVARRLGAGLVLEGSVVGTRESMSLQTLLIDVASRRVAGHADVRGSESDLHDLVDRLVGLILSRTANEEEHRLAHLTSASLPALRIFLAARVAHRRGHYEEALRLYDRALELDSTFALAGLGVMAVSGWVGGSAPVSARASAIANANSHRLSARDRVGVAGRLPGARDEPVTTRLRIREIEDALQQFPDHARLWYLYGDLFLHFAEGIGIEDWAARARESFERAIALDPDYAEPVHHLATVLALVGDTAALRDLATRQLVRVPEGPIADYLQWLARHAIGAPFREPPLDAMHTDATLRWIGIVAQDYGVAIPEGAAAVRLRLERPGIRAEHHERRMGAFAYALNAGRTDEALRVLRMLPEVQPDPHFHHRIAVLAALFANGDDIAAAAAARALAASNDDGPVRELNACILTLWRLREEPSRLPRPAILSEEEALSSDAGSWAVARRMCNLVRDAQWLAREGGAAWHAAIQRLDRLLELGAIRILVDDGHVEYVHLALARLHVEAGSPDRALVALRRRTRYYGWQPYLASILREEARLAGVLGDDEGARRALAHYTAFRNGLASSTPAVDR
jgi:DNA-binding SARP family transcriptional activator